MLKRCGVLGWPVAHSRSPAIHEAAYRAAGLEGWRYQALPVPPELFAETVRALPAAGFVGANVTVPHKGAALEVATEASAAARSIGAANTLTFDGEAIRAENTDAPGFLDVLPGDPAGKRALVLGAGGSARAVIHALREAGAAEVAVHNRTRGRAVALAHELGAVVADEPGPADLLVNCTTAGLAAPSFQILPVSAGDLGRYGWVVDLAYGDGPTDLVVAAGEAGCAVVDGLDVLVAQGARSFALWTGQPAPREAMRAAARMG